MGRIKYDLGAPKQCEHLSRDFALYGGVPELRRPSTMDKIRLAGDAAPTCGADEIGFQLGCGEPGCSLWQRFDAADAACGIG